MWFNPIMKWMLKSPLHFLISGSTMLVTFQGRKSGRYYTTPVNYLQVGDALYIVSSRDRVWWRNLRKGAEVGLYLRGYELRGDAIAIEDQDRVREELFTYLQAAPDRAKYFDVQIDPAGTPDLVDITRLTEEKVVVKVVLGQVGRDILRSGVKKANKNKEKKEVVTWQERENSQWDWIWIHADWHYLPSS